MKILKIEHLGMACRSAEAAAKFYSDVLGLPVVSRETLDDMKLKVVKVRTGESVLELLEPMDGEPVISKFLASLAGRNPVPMRAAYAATKWAMIGLSRSVLQEVRKDGIRVIILEPGSTLTEFGHDAAKMAQAEKLVRPEDVAAVLVAALKLPARATVSEIEIRPTDPPG